VGVKKFQYDIWGDTVNTASRMESSGEVGQVNISEATYALVKDAQEVVNGHNPKPATRQPLTGPAFTFTPRGKVQAKGKGEMEMYFVSRA
ncbi:MAG: adenylate/guanylate cyclase domain-containing protein, partial [Flavobacteriales bacterium]